MRAAQVAVPVPGLDALTYSVPASVALPAVGVRALVPVGQRVMTGVVVQADSATSDLSAAPALKEIIDVLDDAPFLPADVVRLAEWVAEYYMCGLGDALAAAMPPRAWIESERHAQITDLGHARLLLERGLRRELLEALAAGRPMRVETIAGGRRGTHTALAALERDGLVALTQPLRGAADASRTIRVAAITAQGLDVAASCEAPDGVRLGARQRETLDLLASAPAGLATSDLADRGIGPQVLARLAALGLIRLTRQRVDRDPFGDSALPVAPAPAVTLTSEQQGALDTLRALAEARVFRAALLHGVTGSGKTEIYLRLAAAVRDAGRRVLILVPEIALTPAVAGVFRAAFGERVAIQHSGLSEGERYDQWHRIRRGGVDVVVGTRSAVFAPMDGIGLIVVDEEHDASYKQEEAPRYNGRDVAVVRARQAGALVVLGSATPSMESYQNAIGGRYTLVSLSRRVLDRPLADVRIVDMREAYASEGPDTILSRALREALGERLAAGEQAIVLLNRRGYASAVFCRECASTLECPNCSLSLTVHLAARRARCHYCNFSMTLPSACHHCRGPFLEHLGVGTEQVEAALREAFPGARVARVDRDTVRRRGAITALLARFAAGDIDVLVGTQMLAKGHDFPRVTLVGVISADVGLGLADFRAAERTFQLLTQVAGRAGRGELQGQAIVQTLYPNHYSIRHACRQDYRGFFEDEIRFRKAMRYPPAVALVNVIVKGRTLTAAMLDAGQLVAALRRKDAPYTVLGPATAPLARLKGEHRAQFFLKGTNRGAMRKALNDVLAARPEIRRRAIVDVDPMSVL